MKKSLWISVLCLVLVCATMLCGCTKRPKTVEVEIEPLEEVEEEAEVTEEASDTPAPDASASPSPTATASPAPSADYINPLTGLKCVKDYTGRRPIAIMIENNRWNDNMTQIPHGGVSKASIIYEMQVEQITRCMAIFMDLEDAGVIMPVRSARSYFASAAMAYDAIYVHRGESAEGNEYSSTVLQYFVDNDNIDLGDGNSYRIYDAPYYGGEHSMCTTADMLMDYMDNINIRLTHNTDDYNYGLSFTDDAAPTDGSVANEIRVCFPGTKLTNFTYDSTQDAYSCYQWNAEYVDANTYEKMFFKNVLVLTTPTAVAIDDKYHSSMSTWNYQGSGYFFNGGYAEPITWSRGDLYDCFHYYDAYGNELQLGTGRTYVCFIGNNVYPGDYSGVNFQ